MALHVIDIGLAGPLIQVGVRVGAKFDAAGRGGAPGSYVALIDTGAATSAISPRVISDLQPQRLALTTLARAGVAGSACYVYDVRLKFDSHLVPGKWFEVEPIGTAPATAGVDILIGQDLLLKLTVLYNGPLGKLVLMY
jgi:hypothetical protein